ncbi:MAG: hypothetical protein IK024_09290, partial [Treponema sp.]|nr:hypothetical protein [Treponema sp.]
LGETRLATVINDYRNVEDKTFGTEKNHIYFYHSDHLGSAQLVTDHNGDEYQRLEYTPYGETWVDIKRVAVEQVPMNFMFSAKELDKETGFYYYGARYLDPKYSRWISCDPAMNTGEYFPVAPTSDEARQHNGNLPGMGGIFNHINANLYHYAGNNPVKYSDPDGRCPFLVVTAFAGAAIGAIYGACKSYQETGSVDWKEVGKDALIGGAIGLCGGAAVSLGTTFLASGATGATILADSYTISAAVTIVEGKAIAGLSSVLAPIIGKILNNRDSLLNSVSNPKLKNFINMLYRAGAKIGSGSTADAIRYELQTGNLLSPNGHLQKGKEALVGLSNLLETQNLSVEDTAIVKFLIQDLQNAINGK